MSEIFSELCPHCRQAGLPGKCTSPSRAHVPGRQRSVGDWWRVPLKMRLIELIRKPGSEHFQEKLRLS